MFMKKQVLIGIASSILLITTGCGPGAKPPEQQAETPGKVVEMVAASKAKAPLMLTATGIVEAKRDVILSFGTSGKIAQINVNKGSQVQAGSVLAALDTTYYQKAVEAASGQVQEAAARKAKKLQGASSEEIAAAKLDVERSKIRLNKANTDLAQGERLYQGGALSKVELDNLKVEKNKAELDAKDSQIALERLLKGAEVDEIASVNATLQQAASEVERTKKTLQDTKLIAPFGGTIVEVSQEKGELSNPGEAVIHLVDLSEMTVSIDATNDTIDQYHQGTEVTIVNQSGEKTKGKISFVAPVIDQKTGKYRIDITFANPEQRWRGGMLATVEVPRVINGIIVPLEAVGISQSQRYVMVAENGVVAKRPVTVGQIISDKIEVTSGLKENEQVITSGITYLVEGEKVVARGAKN
ncbi:MAG: efflux RND transporter periplasmic adaptor subunit [Clostridia bacterium]